MEQALVGDRAFVVPNIGWALFDRPGPSLDGLTGLSARLKAHFKAKAPQGALALDIGAQGAAEIALSIIAEITAVARGKSGARP